MSPRAAHREGLLAAVDALARELERRATPVRFAVVDGDDVTALLRLRARTVIDNGWRPAAALPDGIERDEYDDSAVQIAGFADGTVVACARLVLPWPGALLPTEARFGVRVSPLGRVVDVGRGIVAPGFRGDGHRVLRGLLGRCWLELRGRGFTRMCGDAPPWLIEAYRAMGFTVETLGPSQLDWGEPRQPMQIDGVASALGVLAVTRGR